MTTRQPQNDPERADIGLREGIESILSRYDRARSSEAFGKAHALWGEFDRVASLCTTAPTVARLGDLIVRWSIGQGRWASVPWIAFLDKRWTTRTSEGVYVIYLFRADMTGVYLTLNQGTEKVKAKFGAEWITELQSRAEQYRGRVSSLRAQGFTVGDGIDMRSNLASVRAYQDSTIAYKLYERDTVPSSQILMADLGKVLDAYETIVPKS